MTESKVSVAQREKLEAEKYLMYAQAMEKGLKIVMEDGVWIGIGIDILLVTGEVHSEPNPILFAQREALVGTFEIINKMSLKGIPVIEDINPIAILDSFISPLGKLVSLSLPEEGTTKRLVPVTIPVDVKYMFGALGFFLDPIELKLPAGYKVITIQNYYYPAIPIQYRIILALLIPGVLRTIFNFLSAQMKATSGIIL